MSVVEFIKKGVAFVEKYVAEILFVAISIRQFIIGDWFAGIVLVVIAGVVFVVNLLKAK